MHNLTHYLLLSAVLLTPASLLARPADSSCPSGQTILKNFSSGAAWDFCWQESNAEGIVLSNIYYKPPSGTRRRVMGEASLAQIQTDYDDGLSVQAMSSTQGLGGSNLKTLNNSDCPQGQLHQANSRNLVCEITRPRGYIYKHTSGQRQGELLELFSVSAVDNRTYVVRWQFYDNGSILPATGLTGSLPRTGGNSENGWEISGNNTVALGFTDHYFWRMDFDIGNNPANDIVEEITSTPSTDRLRKTKNVNTLGSETGRSLNYENKRFWRVRDASTSNGSVGNISYELVILNYAHQGFGNNNESWLDSDIFFTRYNSCERQAVNNTLTGCGDSVDQYANSESLDSEDVVAWYRQTYHHLPRDEDNNRIATRWNTFELLPRDWSAQNPL